MQFLTSSARLRVMPNTEDLCLTVYLVLKAVSVSPDTSGSPASGTYLDVDAVDQGCRCAGQHVVIPAVIGYNQKRSLPQWAIKKAAHEHLNT